VFPGEVGRIQMSGERKICPLREIARGKSGDGRPEVEYRRADCAWWWYQPDVAPEGACVVHWVVAGMSGIKQAVEARVK